MPAQPRAASSLQLPVDLRELPWMRALAIDYAFKFDAVAPFFAGNPADESAWRASIARTLAHPRERDALADLLRAQQQRRDAPPAARTSAAQLREPGTVAVVTGQQAGLFGGPLYTLLKALTAVTLAARVTRELATPAVPVFWIDAEDHDWEEVRYCRVLDGRLEPVVTSLPARPPAGDVPVAAVVLDAAIDAALADLEAALPSTEYSREILTLLRGAYRPGVGMAEAFGRWMEGLLGPLGLVVFDCTDPAAKPLVARIFEQELAAPGRTAELAAAAGAELIARGYHAQVTPQPDTVSLFHLDGGRLPVRQQAGRFRVGENLVDGGALLGEAREHPERFSPNVLLRPVVQDMLFPTVSYVAGPSELAYLAQLRDVYGHFGVPMPLVHPRASATIVDAAAARFLSKYPLPLAALQAQDEAALNRLLESQLPPHVEQALLEATRGVEEQMNRVIGAVPSIDPTLEGAAKSTLGRMHQELRSLHGKVIQASKRRNDTLRRQFFHARAQAFPGGLPQERALGIIHFLNAYGPALVDRLVAELSLDPKHHWVLTV